MEANKETLEEALQGKCYHDYWVDGCKAGAEWQSERMYSDKEVLRIIQDCKSYLSVGDEFDEVKWFEQFKKK